MAYARHLAGRLVALAVTLALVVGLTDLVLRALRPEAFPGSGPLLEEVLSHVAGVLLHFDLGWSTDPRINGPVSDLVRAGFWADVQLLFGSVVLGALVGIAGGVWCASRPRARTTRLLQVLATLAICAPVYWLALVVVRWFTPGVGVVGLWVVGPEAQYVPLGEDPAQWLRSMIAPWFVLGTPIAGWALRMTQSSMREVLDADYLRTAAAKGLRERTVLRRHALPPAASPVVTLLGANMAILVTNVVLVEQVFAIPGVFSLTRRATEVGDFPVLEGIVVVAALLVVVGTFVADALVSWLDPRIR